ncbi:putative transcription factor C2H2 family [Helianthus anomalus]
MFYPFVIIKKQTGATGTWGKDRKCCLSGNQISKCLRELIYCSSDQLQEEGTCVICLEEYANMDDVGMLRGCKHDFHVGCIKNGCK